MRVAWDLGYSSTKDDYDNDDDGALTGDGDEDGDKVGGEAVAVKVAVCPCHIGMVAS